jgi:CRP-like cAMP-binding protein
MFGMLVPKYWYVKGLDLNGTSADVVTEIRDVGRMERWGHRARVHHRDEPDEVYVVLEGGVRLHDGAHDVTLRLKPGDVYGETGLQEHPTHELVRAHDDTVLAALDRDAFEKITTGQIGELQTQIGLVRRQSLAVPATLLLYTAPKQRVARVLLHLVEEYGAVEEESGLVDFGLRTRNLARLTGLAQHTVSDIFDTMQRERVVEVGRTELVIPSLDQIRELAIK